MAMVEGNYRVLVLCGDRWHPAETIQRGLEPIEGALFTLEFIENTQDWSEERMMKYDLTILTKSNNVSSEDETPWMTGEVQEAFLRYVESGNGLLIIHSGT